MDTIYLHKIDTVEIYYYDTIINSKVDTVVICDVPPELINQYTQLLDKTTSLWTNPASVSVAVLAILFTLLTIIAAVVLWTQRSEFRKLIKDTVGKYEGILSNLVKEKTAQLQGLEKLVTQKIAELEENLGKASEEKKKELERELEDLRTQQEYIKKEKNKPYREYISSFKNMKIPFEFKDDHMFCPYCSAYFKRGKFTYDVILKETNASQRINYCPSCNRILQEE